MYNNQAPNTGYGPQNGQYQNGDYGGYEGNQGQDPENFQDEGYGQPASQQQYNPQLQRSIQQQQGLQRSTQREQALGSKQFEKEERRQNLLCFLFVTLGLVISAVVAMAIFLSIWLTQDDDVTTIINNTETPMAEDRTNDLPTPSPTSAPTWRIRSQLQSNEGVAVGYGAAVALAGDLLVVGAPNFAQSGRVETLQQSSSGTLSFSPITGASASEADTEEFGIALDMTLDTNGDPIVIVGSTRSVGAQNKNNVFGSAHVYDFSGSAWQSSGNVIRGPEEVEDAAGRCGESVAVSSVGRIAVSCPSTSKVQKTGLNTGAVHVLQLVGTAWAPMNPSPLTGQPESYFGQSIDISDDGTKLLIGAPGDLSLSANGRVEYYSFEQNRWTRVFALDGTSGESLGASVQILTSDGSRFAVGSPGASSGIGSVRVFELDTTSGVFEQLGGTIPGAAANERVGDVLAGSDGKVAVGTGTGRIRVYEYSNGSWNQLGDSPNPGSGSAAILSLAISNDATVVAAGLEDLVAVYERT